MKYCVDTWFLIQISKDDEKAKNILRETGGKEHLIIPSITFTELTRKLLRKGKKMDEISEIFRELEKNRKVQISHTTKELVLEAGKLGHTFSIPTIDSIIASTAKLMGCNMILSNDSDYTKFCKQNKIKLKNW